MQNLQTFEQVWWVRIPGALARVSRLFSTISMDGAYLRAWPLVATVAPVLCLVFGFLTGWLHFSDGIVYTQTIGVMALFVLASGLGAGLGLWLLVGYVLGDFLLFGHRHPYDSSIFTGVVVMRLSLVIVYVLLAKLVCLVPLVSRGLRQQLVGGLKLEAPVSTIVTAVVQGLLQAALVWVWVQATPTLIRPVFTWVEGTPPVDAMRPLQQEGLWLVALGFLLGVARAILESLPAAKRALQANRVAVARSLQAHQSPVPIRLPFWFPAIIRALFATFMMSGIIQTWFEAISFFILLLGAQLLRGVIATQAWAFVQFINRVPIILRIMAGALVSYLVASQVIPAYWGGGGTFLPVLMTAASSMIVFSLLLPGGTQPRKEVIA